MPRLDEDTGAGSGLQRDDSYESSPRQEAPRPVSSGQEYQSAVDSEASSNIQSVSSKRSDDSRHDLHAAATQEHGDTKSEASVVKPRRPCCSCIRRRVCNVNTHRVSATPTEVAQILNSMRHLMLKDDVIVGGELVKANSYLLRVGRKWKRRGSWELSPQIEEDAKTQMQDCIVEEQGVRLTFKTPAKALPWCIPLTCPCFVFFITVCAVAGLCLMGISGSVSVDTNFDSFMNSDSDSSLYYNALLDAMKARPDQDARRLRADEPPRRCSSLFSSFLFSPAEAWRNFEDMAKLPILDDHGFWYPLRFLAWLVFGHDSRDYGTWLEAPPVGNNSDNTSRRLQGTPLFKLYTIHITYATNPASRKPREVEFEHDVVDPNNILTNELLQRIHSIESRLKLLPEWKELCEAADPGAIDYCRPGVSFVNIVYAARHKKNKTGTENTLFFNGSGTDPLPLETAVGFAKSQGILPIMFPREQATKEGFQVEGLPCRDLDNQCPRYESQGECKPFAQYEKYMRDFCAYSCNFCGPADAYGGYTVNYGNTNATARGDHEMIKAIRSNFRFQSFCCFSTDPNKGKGTARLAKIWNSFIAAMVDFLEQEQQDGLRVLYAGDGIEGYEAMSALASDLRWAGGSYAFVLCYATLHTRSIFLSFVGLFLVMLSIPSALAIFSLASGSETISLMSCLSVFIVVGLGSDMLFVYTDFWKQSVLHSRDPVKRLKFTYTQASSSTAATTFTTAMSFLANLASVLRPLREFGFFMGACVVSAWIIMFFAYPPILVVGERCHRRLRYAIVGTTSTEQAEPTKEIEGPAGPRGGAGSARRSSVAQIAKRSTVVMAAMLDPEKKGVGEMHQHFLGVQFSEFLRDRKCCILILFFVATTASLGMALKNLTQASGVPQIFPKDHNQPMSKEWDNKFISFNKDIAGRAAKDATECSDLFQTCTQYRCETRGTPMGTPKDCLCYPHGELSGKCTKPYTMRVTFRILARQGLPWRAVANANFSGVLATQFPNAKKITSENLTAGYSECLTQNWESGKQMIAIMARPGYTDAVLRDLNAGERPSICEEKQVCYCGVERCLGAGSGIGYGTLKLDDPSRRLSTAEATNIGEASYPHPLADPVSVRQLQVANQVRPEDMVDVNLVFGMNVVGTNPTLGPQKTQAWEFAPAFKMQDPWTQRGIEKLCETMKDAEELEILSTRCWLLGFRDYWRSKGKDYDWPVRPNIDINKEIHQYATTRMTDDFQTTTFIWFEEGGKKVVATYVVFFLRVPKTIDAGKAMDIMHEWDTYIDKFNEDAEKSIKGIWHACKLWVRAEAEKVILDSTLVTLGISLGCVCVGIFLFTGSVHLALLVMVIVTSIIICLLFFMTVFMEWPIGAIEVLSLIVFVGFAVDYCLHIAHKYHTCHVTDVKEIPPGEEEDEDTTSSRGSRSIISRDNSFVSRSPKPSPRLSGTATQNSKWSHGSGGRASKRGRASIAVEIDDKPKTERSLDKIEANALRGAALSRPDERFSRVRYAIMRMGGAVVGSAFTTVGCAAFLLPCKLYVFVKIGSVVMAVTLYAILYTILPLPALLMMCGPCKNDLHNFVAWSQGKLDRFHGKGKQAQPLHRPEDLAPRRYMMHMPVRAMGAVGPGIPATRTRVTASG